MKREENLWPFRNKTQPPCLSTAVDFRWNIWYNSEEGSSDDRRSIHLPRCENIWKGV